MLKKFLIIIIIIGLSLFALGKYGGRDFSQISFAWDKYQHSGEIGGFFSDLGVILQGGYVKAPSLPFDAEKFIYRWTDEQGQLRISENRPDVANYEKIKIGDMKFESQKAMTKEEIESILNKN